ncbi:MAG: cytochrome c [Myxococcales bacterium]|nr:cytochrome c [Myxococcales bacterium]
MSRVTPRLAIPLALMLAGCPGDDPDPGSSDSSGTDPSGADSSGTDSSGGVDTTGDPSGDPTAGPTAGPDASGEELYGQLCSPCHGPNGVGTTLGYELQHPVREFSTWVVRNGRPGDEFENSSMSAYGTNVVSDTSLEEIWDYLDAQPQPTTGEGLYLDYCANCHGVDATGGVVGKDISDKTFADSLERVREGAGLSDPGARMFYMPAFDTDVVSDQELQLLIDHVATL